MTGDPVSSHRAGTSLPDSPSSHERLMTVPELGGRLWGSTGYWSSNPPSSSSPPLG